jgi:hypothetical protein
MKTRASRRGSIQLRTTLLQLAFGLQLLVGPAVGQTQQIACGQTITSAINSPGQTNTYTFDANAGERVTLLALGQSMNAVADVYDPTGSQIGGSTNSFTGPINLASTGTYTIRVHADNSESTGTCGLSLSFLTGRCGSPLIWGLPTTNTVTALAEVDSYTFRGNAGETVAIYAPGSGNFTAAAFVAGPDGTIIANWVNGGTSIDLASTGTYTVGVYSFYFEGTGTYSLTMSYTKLVAASYRLAIGATNGAAAVTIWGQVGHTMTLRYATNLVTPVQWFTLTNFSLPWSPYRFVDWASGNSPQRFYQTVQ